MFKNYLQLMLRLSIFVFSLNAFSQSVSYSPPAHYLTNQLMTPLSPTQTGGAINGGTYGQVSLFAGTGVYGGSDNSNPLNATFGNVRGMVKDAKGNYYIAEYGSGKIRKISSSGVVSTAYSSSDEYFSDVKDLAINNATGTIYFVLNNALNFLINSNATNYPAEDPIYIHGGILVGSISNGDADGNGGNARFNTPYGITIAPDNSYLLFTDTYNHKIRKVNLSTFDVTTFSGGSAGNSNGSLATATYNLPIGIEIVNDDLIYVTDYNNGNVRKIHNGQVTTLAGGNNFNGISFDGTGSAAYIDHPHGLTVDAMGNLYVAEWGNNKIRKITPEGVVSTLAGTLWSGNSYYGNANGNGNNARFNHPEEIFYDAAKGFLLVSDRDNHQIRKIQIEGFSILPEVVAGMHFDTVTGTFSGTPTAASLKTQYVQNFETESLGVVNGSEVIMNTNATIKGGKLILTSMNNSQFGGIAIPATGENSNLLKVAFDLITIKPTDGADGLSYSFAPDAVATSTDTAAEMGTGTKLSISFADYNANRGIRLFYNPSASSLGTSLDAHLLAYSTISSWISNDAKVVISVSQDGKLTLTLDGLVIFNAVQLPADYLSSNKSTWKHVFKARTGGAFDMHAIDNVTIQQGLGATTHTIVAQNYHVAQTLTTSINVITNLEASVAQTNNTCYGDTNGAASVTVTSGTAPFTYNWAPSGGSSATATGLTAGIYTCTITDANSLSVDKVVTITSPATPVIASETTQVACSSYTWAATGQTYTTSGEYTHLNAAPVISNTYCEATTSNFTGKFITYVSFNQINHNSTYRSNGYENFEHITQSVVAGYSFQILVQSISFYGDKIAVWADWNQDGDFTDTGEEYLLDYNYVTGPAMDYGQGMGNIAVPAGAFNGNVRMRIRIFSSQSTVQPCGTNSSGETEDYTLVVSGGATPCPTYDKLVLTINPITINTTTEVACGSYTWAATGQTYTTSGEYTHENSLYCEPQIDDLDEFISNVTIGTINKNSSFNSGYENYLSNSTAVVAGSSHPISITNGQSYSSDAITVWADWNQDGDFTDSGEAFPLDYAHSVNGDEIGTGTGIIVVPADASNGNVRMRIRVVYNRVPQPCGNSRYGEVEDYTLVVSGGVAPVLTCPTFEKLVLTINTRPAAPTASAQTFSGIYTIADLVATGTDLKWYTAATGGTALATTTVLATGTYYVSQTINCESTRTSVAVTVNSASAPTASDQTFCSGKTIADLVATGTDLKWYDVAANGTALASPTTLVTGTYYVSQTLNSLESARTSVAVTITPSTSNTTTETACDTYTWSVNGTTYTTSGTYTLVTGCHSETLNLTVVPNSIVFTTQPNNTSICNKYGTVNLTATIAPIVGATYQWKVQTATGTTWENANNSSVHYSGATTHVLNIQQATALLNNNKYKLVVTAPTSCISVVTSDICVLTVNPIPSIALISGAGTICENSATTLRIANTLVGSVQWQVSTENTTIGFTDIQGATGNTYTTDALSATTYYRVVITSGACASRTSSAVAVTVIPAPIAGIISGGNVTVCAYATSGLDLSGTSVPFSNSTLLSVAGTTGTILWQKSTNYENATGATPVWTSALSTTNELTVTNLTADTWYRVLVFNSACSVASTPVKITVTKAAIAGSITGASSVCRGGDITFTSSAYIGTSIQWEVSTTSAASGFSPIADANQLSFTMSAIAYAQLSKFYVRSVVTSGNCSLSRSAVKTITVSPQSVAGTVTGGGIICPGANGTVKVTGYTGAVQWQSSTDGISYVNVPTSSATSATYSATNITADTYFRAKITSGICSEVYSNAVQFTIGTAVAGTLTAANETVCKGTGTTLTLNQSVGTIKWWKSINWTVATPTWTAVTSTTPTVSTGNLTVSTAYKAEVTIGTCSTATSQVVPVIVIAAPLAKTITANVTSPTGTTSTFAICTTSTSKVLTIGAGSVGAIQWQRSSTSSTSGFVDIADATATSYTVTNPTVGANYFRAKFTNSCGTSVFGTAFRVYYKECTPTKAIASSEFGKTSFAVVSHPNPFTNNFNLDVTSSSSEKVEVLVYDMIGRLLEKHQENVSEINTLEIGTSYPAGVYNVIVTQGMEVKTVRVIKK